MSSPPTPHTTYNFVVEIDGVSAAGFSEISGLNLETQVEEVKEGGTNNFTYKLPKNTVSGNLTLKKGIATSAELYDWYVEVINGRITAKDISILLLDYQQSEVRRWLIKKAFPIKWNGPDLSATSNNIAIETLEFANHGWSIS